jgi:hypothetical protein
VATSSSGALGPLERSSLTEKSLAADALSLASCWSLPTACVRLPGVGRVAQPSATPAFPDVDRFQLTWQPPRAEDVHGCTLQGFVIEVLGTPIGGTAVGAERGAARPTQRREIEVAQADASALMVTDLEGGCMYSVRIRPVARLSSVAPTTASASAHVAADSRSDPSERLLGDWSVPCQLALPAIATLPPPTFVSLPGDKACVRWRRPACVECELTGYEVAHCEAGGQGGPTIGADGKTPWSVLLNADVGASRPEQLVPPHTRIQPRTTLAHQRVTPSARDATSYARAHCMCMCVCVCSWRSRRRSST